LISSEKLLNLIILADLLSVFKAITGKQFYIVKKIMIQNRVLIKTYIDNLRLKKQILYTNEKVDQSFDNLKILNDLTDFEAIIITGNGNCLYNSISYIFYGNEDMFFEIKLGMLSIIFENEIAFRTLLRKTSRVNSFETFVEYIAAPLSWGDEYCEVAISILLNKALNVYSIDPKTNIPYSHEYCMNRDILKNKPISIDFLTNHFTALLAKKEEVKANVPLFNQFIYKYENLFIKI
jgi:hypothetical protein